MGNQKVASKSKKTTRRKAKSKANSRELKRTEESLLQERCVTWFRYNYPQYRKLFFAVPNGGFRSKRTGYVLSLEGVTRGVADCLLLVPSGDWHGLAIEFKTPIGVIRKEQIGWGGELMEAGYLYLVVRSYEAFLSVVERYLGYRL